MEKDDLKVLIVDDTSVYRTLLRGVVNEIEGAVVVGTAGNGKHALARMEVKPVDLVLLDIQMPEMDGLKALEEIVRRDVDVGVVIISGVNQDSADLTVKALQKGALDFIAKPGGADFNANREKLIKKLDAIVRTFSVRRKLRKVKARALASLPAPGPAEAPTSLLPRQDNIVPEAIARTLEPAPNLLDMQLAKAGVDIVAIGVSTGGPKALSRLIPSLPADLGVPILIVQHMPPVFTGSLARSLQAKSNLRVVEATDGQPVEPNTVTIAPGGKHMVVLKHFNQISQEWKRLIRLTLDPPENSCRPAVDVLFRSIARAYDGKILAVIMTGMGEDGQRGVAQMKQSGCYCITQDESSAVVYGMPKAVAEAGLSDESVGLKQIAARIAELVRK